MRSIILTVGPAGKSLDNPALRQQPFHPSLPSPRAFRPPATLAVPQWWVTNPPLGRGAMRGTVLRWIGVWWNGFQWIGADCL
ncbi:MAG: hypothetical protein ACKOJF_17860, partial [Planctomycetaceae bacterium]